jgi:hypothetical protein
VHFSEAEKVFSGPHVPAEVLTIIYCPKEKRKAIGKFLDVDSEANP